MPLDDLQPTTPVALPWIGLTPRRLQLDALPTPSVPSALVPLISGRGVFADLWRRDPGVGTGAWAGGLALELARRGFDRAGIAACLASHPILGLTAEAVEALATDATQAPAESPARRCDVRVVRWYRQDPAVYVLEVSGSELSVAADDMTCVSRLVARCLRAGIVPHLPNPKDYLAWLAGQIEASSVVEQPQEASDAGALSEYIDAHLAAMPYCEEPDRMSDCRYYLHAGHRYIRGPDLYRRIEREWQGATRGAFYSHLRSCGWSDCLLRLPADVIMRCWRRPDSSAAPPSVQAEFDLARDARAADERQTAAASSDRDDLGWR